MIIKSFNDFLTEKENNFEIVQKDGEWALFDTTKGGVTLYGPKEDLEKVLSSLAEGFINEEFTVTPVGLKGAEYHIKLNGHDYGYKAKPGSELTIQEIGEKFVKIIKYSSGKAFAWLKKNTDLASGSKKNESQDVAMLDFMLEHFAPKETKIKLFESFISEGEERDIEDMAVDMIDFYGGALPSSPTEYGKVRDIHDQELLMSIFDKAQEFDQESNEAVDWEAVMRKPATEIHTDLKSNKYDAKSLQDYITRTGDKIDQKQRSEFEKAMKTFKEEKNKAEELEKENAKKNREKEDIMNKIEKLTKENTKDTTGEDRKSKIAEELEKLNKKLKAIK
jgi:hypothetical protein